MANGFDTNEMIKRLEIPRRIGPVILLTDTSFSVSGKPLHAINNGIKNTLGLLSSMNKENADVEIRIAVLEFNTDVKWVTGRQLTDPSSIEWKDLTANGCTSMGKAFKELNQVLSVNRGIMNHATGSVSPVIFLLSDGDPTDAYKEALDELKENNWYKVAARAAIGYGNSNDDVLREFTQNAETVLHTDSPEELKRLIQFVTITSSMVTSNNYGGDMDEEDTDMTKKVANALKTAPPKLADTGDDLKW